MPFEYVTRQFGEAHRRMLARPREQAASIVRTALISAPHPWGITCLQQCRRLESLVVGGSAVKHFDAARLATTWLFAPRKCAPSRSERPRAAKTNTKNP
jgi:hypothetical protein